MTSSPERRNELSSSTLLASPTSSQPFAASHRHGHDAAASICAHLIADHGLSRVRIAHALGLPSLVVEESIRNGVSSVTLRTQLRNWLYEMAAASPAPTKLRVPELLFAQLQEDCAADELDRQERQRAGAAAPSGDDRSPFAALDPISQRHFTRLQQSVGQSFISILNDPGEATASVDWTTWLGGKLYEAFDFNGRTGDLEDVLRSYAAAQTGPESSAALLAEHPPQQDFSGYVRLISEAYQANRREGIANDAQEWRDDDAADAAGDPWHRGSGAAGNGPWPSGVPTLFFAASYDVAVEMRSLSDAVGESPPPAPPGEVAARDRAATSTAAVSPTRVVDGGTFAADFEYLECRNKELRAWESAVEKCLLRHVKHRSEDFFATSRQFGSLSEDARAVLADARVAREGGMRAGELFIAEYLRIGQLYRRRQNFVRLNATATTAQHMLRRIGDVENWAALPERDLGEVQVISSALTELEAVVRGSRDAEQGIAWDMLSRLRCLAEVPGRMRRARKILERVVLDEYCRVLLSGSDEAEAGERATAVCESATRLGLLNTANQLYLTKVVEVLHVMAQESLVSLFMNAGALDDARANELLTIASDPVALAQADARQRLCEFAKQLHFESYLQVLQQFTDVLVDFVTQVSQNWGFFITGALRAALAMYDNCHSIMESATKDLLGRVCGESESLIATLLEVYASGPSLSSMREMVQLVRVSVQFPMQVSSNVASRLAALLRDDRVSGKTPPLSPSTSPNGSAAPSPTAAAAAAAAAGDPPSFAVYRPTRVIGTTVQRLVKRFFRHQHGVNKERVAMVVEGETWTAKEAVDEAIQQQVEKMCSLEASELRAFRLRALWALGVTGAGDGPLRDSTSPPRRAAAPAAAAVSARLTGGADELLSAGATKLYVRVRASGEAQELEGRHVPSSLLVLMDLLHRYHECMAAFPFLAFDAVSRMCELLDAYEGQVAAMVLGARAVENGTLTTITTQHLCVASQCVAFLIDFIPALQTHLASAVHGDVQDATLRDRTSRGAVAVATALGLVGAAMPTHGDTSSVAAAAPERAKLFIENDWNRVTRNCRAHRNEFFSKIGSLVYRKVDDLGHGSVQKGQWLSGGNQWVMAMLREVARLMRAVQPLLPRDDRDGVVVTLLGLLSVMLRESTTRIPAASADDRAAAASDVMLFKANVENFGYDVLRCAEVTSVAAVMQSPKFSFTPVSSEDAVLRWFLPPASTASPARPTAGAPPTR
ncbi:Vps54-like protein [Novymonas esmeraldas]|uniref:Vps54-like protein n=1 Tax=Novymonas esmeraldas TaxID=1808958 RepID=A0AAW0F9W5_9TRYP